MLPVIGYYAGFTALFHMTASGRINYPMKLLLCFFAAYLLAVVIANLARPAETT